MRTIERYRGSSPVYEMVRYHFGYSDGAAAQHGKRLRPQLLLRVALAEGARPEAALDAAVAVEILHNYSLVHDDIEDGDALRHGRATLWSRFGVAHGINAGDSMCALSYLSLLSGDESAAPERLAGMARVLHEANLAMCEGQGLDIAFESRGEVTMDEYLEMIAGKTGALFAASCELGALAAGADEERARAYAAFGAAFGRAFQIRDDELGTWGASRVTGKPSGADIARRKWSFPVVWALGAQASAEREIVAGVCTDAGSALDAAEVARVIAALERLARARRRRATRTIRRWTGPSRSPARTRAGPQAERSRDLIAQGARRVA